MENTGQGAEHKHNILFMITKTRQVYNLFLQYIERKAREKSDPGDGSTLVKITGCEYKITEERSLFYKRCKYYWLNYGIS